MVLLRSPQGAVNLPHRFLATAVLDQHRISGVCLPTRFGKCGVLALGRAKRDETGGIAIKWTCMVLLRSP